MDWVRDIPKMQGWTRPQYDPWARDIPKMQGHARPQYDPWARDIPKMQGHARPQYDPRARYQPGCSGIFWRAEGTSQPVTISTMWKNPSSALQRKRTWVQALLLYKHDPNKKNHIGSLVTTIRVTTTSINLQFTNNFETLITHWYPKIFPMYRNYAQSSHLIGICTT